LNLNGAITTTSGLTIANAQIYNPTYTGNTGFAGTTRWTETTAPVIGGSSFSALEANTTMMSPAPASTVFPANTITGLSRSSVGDPNYFPSAVVPGGSTGGAWLLGQVTFNVTGQGTSTLVLSAGPLDITKSGPSATTVLTPQYTFGTGTITFSNPVLPGDTNNDHTVNLQDYINVVNNLGTSGPTGGPPNGPLGDTSPFDGSVNLQDYINVVNNLGTSNGAGSLAAVPEPSSLVLFSLAGLAMAGFVRKNRRSA